MQSVQIQASEKAKVLGYNCVINDVFYASEIEQVIHNKRSRKVALKPVGQTLAWCGRRVIFKTGYVLIMKEDR